MLVALVAVSACRTGEETNIGEAVPATTRGSAPTAAAGLVLRNDGLGAVGFGAGVEPALALLRDELGAEDEITGPYTPGEGPLGVCPGEHYRVARWGRLHVTLTTGRTDVSGDDGEHFSAYHYGWPPEDAETPDLETDGGVGIGSTVDALGKAHPDARVYEDELIGAAYEIGAIDSYPFRIWGGLTATAGSGTVVNVMAGALCGE